MICATHQNPAHVNSFRVVACDLVVEDFEWAFARKNSKNIQLYWRKRRSETPHFFDGRVHLLSQYSADKERFVGTLFEVDFKSFLYWRDHEHSDATVFDVFGSALIRSQDGAILLGRQRKGHINEGYFYLPGGLIDPRDIGADRKVNIRSSILREVAEETGLSLSEIRLSSDFIVTVSGQQVSVAVEVISRLCAKELVSKIQTYLSKDPTSELEEVRMVSHIRELDHLMIPSYASALLKSALKG